MLDLKGDLKWILKRRELNAKIDAEYVRLNIGYNV
jgi:hypothetical protein